MTTSREIQWLRASEEARAALTPAQRRIVAEAKVERARQEVAAQLRAAQWINEQYPKRPRTKTRKIYR